MILTDLLCQLNPEEIVYLGTKDGGSFIWIAKVRDLQDMLLYLSGFYFLKLNTSLQNNEREIHNILDKAISSNDKEYVESCLEEIQKKRKTIRNYRNAIDSWKMIDRREVIDYYKHFSDPEGLNVIIDGREHGLYWMINEIPDVLPEEKRTVEDYTNDLRIHRIEYEIGESGTRKITNAITGEVYDSVKDASFKTKIPISSIYKILRGHNTGERDGYKFEYIVKGDSYDGT